MRVNLHVFFNEEFNGAIFRKIGLTVKKLMDSNSSRARKSQQVRQKNKMRVHFHVYFNEDFNGDSFSFLGPTVQKLWIRVLAGQENSNYPQLLICRFQQKAENSSIEFLVEKYMEIDFHFVFLTYWEKLLAIPRNLHVKSYGTT